MTERNTFLTDLLANVDMMIESIEIQEQVEPDFELVREYAEQLREEIVQLRES